MIFDRDLARLILEGKKTMTRRPVAAGHTRAYYRAGRTYPLQRPKTRAEMTRDELRRVDEGRGRPPRRTIAHIQVTDIRCEPLGDITFEDVLSEGFNTTDEFRYEWVEIHDRTWIRTMDAILGELSCPEPDLITDDVCDRLGLTERALRSRLRWLARAGAAELVDGVWERREHGEATAADERFDQRHASTAVWVIKFDLDVQERTRILAPAARPLGSERGYVSSRRFDGEGHEITLVDEPEAVHEQALESITERAGMEHRQWKTLEDAQRAKDLELLAFEERIAAAHRAARLRHIDISHELHILDQQRRKSLDPSITDRRLRKIEARVYPKAA